LAPLPTLSADPEYDAAELRLPARTPVVTADRLLPALPPSAAMHRTALSEDHSVASQTLSPSRTRSDQFSIPIPDPINVTLADPVETLFVAKLALTKINVKEKALLCVPLCSPTVIPIRLLLLLL
jgi:hypothetical protein